jgi:hypothetical protein
MVSSWASRKKATAQAPRAAFRLKNLLLAASNYCRRVSCHAAEHEKDLGGQGWLNGTEADSLGGVGLHTTSQVRTLPIHSRLCQPEDSPFAPVRWGSRCTENTVAHTVEGDVWESVFRQRALSRKRGVSMLVMSGRFPEKKISPDVVPAIEVEIASAPVPSLQQVSLLLEKRLEIARKGLSELRRHLRGGDTEDAERILENIDEDLHLLRRRLQSEVPPGN